MSQLALALSPPPASTEDDIEVRAAEIAGRLNRAHADLVGLAVSLLDGDRWAGGGIVSAEHWLVLRVGVSPARARDIVLIARRRAELPTTAHALDDGSLSLDQAAVVARHVPAHHERAAAELAVNATVPQLRRALSRYRFTTPPKDDDRADTTADTGSGDTTADTGSGDTTADTGSGGDATSMDPPPTPTPPDPRDLGAATSDGAGPPVGSAAWAAAAPSLSMHHTDGRFFLRYDAPSDVGALVEQALLESKDALFRLAAGLVPTTAAGEPPRHDPAPAHATAAAPAAAPAAGSAAGSGAGPGAGPEAGSWAADDASRRQRVTLADALAELARRSLGACSPESRREHYRVYVHLTADGAWVNGRGAIPPSLAARFACDGTAQAVHERDGVPVSVGRALRIVPDRTRRLVEDRDRGCRYPGCPTTRHLEVHHLDHWADGGRTDLDRLVCLCPRHHDAHHRGEFTMTGDPTLTLSLALGTDTAQGLRFTDANGQRLGPLPPRLDAVDRPGAPYAGPPGDVLHLHLVELATNEDLARADAWRDEIRRATGTGATAGPRSTPPAVRTLSVTDAVTDAPTESSTQVSPCPPSGPHRMTSVLDLIADGRWDIAGP